jgi:signal transduction histidine kinase
VTTPRRWWRSTIRVRLTLLYAVAFFLAGAALVGGMYFFLNDALDHQLSGRLDATRHLADTTSHDPATAILPPEVREELHDQFRQDRDDTLDTMLAASLIALAVISAVAAAFGWFLAGRALRPLHQITATARRVADRSLHERIGLDGPDDEIKDLADTFDAMLERLDRSFDSQRRFVANASHELRTPLTINRTLIEVALEDQDSSESLRELGRTLLAVNRRHERLIDGLLTLASSEQGLTDDSPVDLSDIAQHVIAEARTTPEADGLGIRTQLGPAPVVGDPVLLERLVQNLIDNAIRYNDQRDGMVSVTTATSGAHGCLIVENTGPRIPPHELPVLFQPFRRLEAAERLAPSATTRGAGFGLSIVQAVVHAHAGEVHASGREEGGGLIIEVRIPRDQSAPGRKR